MRFWRGKEAVWGGEAGRLRGVAVRLGEEMEEAGFALGAAYVGLAVEALAERLPAGWGREAALPGEEAEFEIDEHGRVWVVRDGICEVIGRRDAVVAEMRRFLREIGPK